MAILTEVTSFPDLKVQLVTSFPDLCVYVTKNKSEANNSDSINTSIWKWSETVYPKLNRQLCPTAHLTYGGIVINSGFEF